MQGGVLRTGQGDAVKFFGFALKDAATTSCAEVCCELGRYYEEAGDLQEAVLWYQNAASETESILDIRTSCDIPREGLKRCGMPIQDESQGEKA